MLTVGLALALRLINKKDIPVEIFLLTIILDWILFMLIVGEIFSYLGVNTLP